MPGLIPGLILVFVVLALFIEKDPTGGVRISKRVAILKEFWWFIRERKIWWMTPIVLILAILSVFIVMSESSVVLPFIYML